MIRADFDGSIFFYGTWSYLGQLKGDLFLACKLMSQDGCECGYVLRLKLSVLVDRILLNQAELWSKCL